MEHKHPWRIAFTVLMSVLAVLGWTLHWHMTINNVKQAPSPYIRPPGVMTAIQCASIKLGTQESDLIQIYGSTWSPSCSPSRATGSIVVAFSFTTVEMEAS